MDKLLAFLIQSSIALFVFYAYFYFFLRKSKFFLLNRFFLLAASLAAVLIPFLKFPSLVFNETSVLLNTVLDDINVFAYSNVNSFDVEIFFLSYVYWIGVSVALITFMFKIFSLLLLLYRNTAVQKDKYVFVEMNNKNIAFSFFSYIFLSLDLNNEDVIISHELVHAKQLHSMDIILINILQAILWFNPIIYFFKKAIQENHEYIADNEVIKHHSAGGYLQLLLNQTMAHSVSVTNCFAHSNLKKRIKMMKKENFGRYAFVKYVSAFALPVVMLFVFTGFTCRASSFNEIIKSDFIPTMSSNIIADTLKVVEDEPVFVKAEIMPSFVGGPDNMYKFLASNVRYPKIAKDKKITGRVFVGFIIEKDGSVSSAKVLRPVSPLLDAEALRLIISMPNWIPGSDDGKAIRVRYTVPINFALK